MAKYSRTQFAAALVGMLDSHSQSNVIKVAAHEIVARRWVRDLELVLQDIAQALLVQKKHLEITVVSAHELTSAVKKEVTQLFKNKYGAATVALNTAEDASLIGGLIARTPAGELDLSVRRQLNQLTH